MVDKHSREHTAESGHHNLLQLHQMYIRYIVMLHNTERLLHNMILIRDL